MSELVPVYSKSFDNIKQALGNFVLLRCVGVPKEYVKLTDEPTGETTVTLYSNDKDSLPPGYPSHKERLEARQASLVQAHERIEKAVIQTTGWEGAFNVRFSPEKQDYVMAIDLAPEKGSDDFNKKSKALNKLLMEIQKETGIMTHTREIDFDHEHLLSPQTSSGLSIEFPLSPKLLKLAHCEALEKYDDGPDGGRGRKIPVRGG